MNMCSNSNSKSNSKRLVELAVRCAQVVALCTLPELLDDARFPEDSKARARRLLASTRGSSVGARCPNLYHKERERFTWPALSRTGSGGR